MGRRSKNKLKKLIRDFNFFVSIYDNGFTFCGKDLTVKYKFIENDKGLSPLLAFKEFNNGETSFICDDIATLKKAIIGKKSWGFHLKMWMEGIREGTLYPYEILNDFKNMRIEIPDVLLNDFNQRIKKCQYRIIGEVNPTKILK